MKTLLLLACALIPLFTSPAFAAPQIGKEAPDFSATDTHGQQVTLSTLKGKTVVLEWTNHECPFVRKHYGSNNMQTLQKDATADGVIWISIVSSGKDMEGNTTADEANKIVAEQNAHPTYKILDVSGDIGQLYGAKTTPHMFVIDQKGVLAYAGAIDDKPGFEPEDLKTAKNYVRAALADLKAGRAVETPLTNPYGCSVKY